MTIEMDEGKFLLALEDHGQALNAACVDAAKAEDAVARQLAEYRARYQERTELPCPPDVVEQVEGRYREQYDGGLRERASTLEREHRAIGQAIDKAIEASRVLPHYIEQAPDNDLRAIRYHMELERAERQLHGMTRTQLLAAYQTTTDERDRTLVALIEREQHRLTLKDDPEHDVVAVSRLQRVIDARQQQRIPKWLTDAKARHAEIRTLHFDHLHRHLTRDQRGIAAVR